MVGTNRHLHGMTEKNRDKPFGYPVLPQTGWLVLLHIREVLRSDAGWRLDILNEVLYDSVNPSKYWNGILKYFMTIPSTFFTIYYLLINLLFDAIQFELPIASLNQE
jgi:hypothetical protein